jgi:hypothetical protein
MSPELRLERRILEKQADNSTHLDLLWGLLRDARGNLAEGQNPINRKKKKFLAGICGNQTLMSPQRAGRFEDHN